MARGSSPKSKRRPEMTSRLPLRRGASWTFAADLDHSDDARIGIDATIDDMLRALLISALLAAMPTTALPAFAQSAPTGEQSEDALEQRLDRRTRVLDRGDDLPTDLDGET